MEADFEDSFARLQAHMIDLENSINRVGENIRHSDPQGRRAPEGYSDPDILRIVSCMKRSRKCAVDMLSCAQTELDELSTQRSGTYARRARRVDEWRRASPPFYSRSETSESTPTSSSFGDSPRIRSPRAGCRGPALFRSRTDDSIPHGGRILERLFKDGELAYAVGDFDKAEKKFLAICKILRLPTEDYECDTIDLTTTKLAAALAQLRNKELNRSSEANNIIDNILDDGYLQSLLVEPVRTSTVKQQILVAEIYYHTSQIEKAASWVLKSLNNRPYSQGIPVETWRRLNAYMVTLQYALGETELAETWFSEIPNEYVQQRLQLLDGTVGDESSSLATSSDSNTDRINKAIKKCDDELTLYSMKMASNNTETWASIRNSSEASGWITIAYKAKSLPLIGLLFAHNALGLTAQFSPICHALAVSNATITDFVIDTLIREKSPDAIDQCLVSRSYHSARDASIFSSLRSPVYYNLWIPYAPLHLAIRASKRKRMEDIALLLIRNGAKSIATQLRGSSIITALHVAAYVGNEKIVRALLHRGDDPQTNAVMYDDAGKMRLAWHTPSDVAFWMGNRDVKDILGRSNAATKKGKGVGNKELVKRVYDTLKMQSEPDEKAALNAVNQDPPPWPPAPIPDTRTASHRVPVGSKHRKR
jgi:tetratricopeptide (TPR) repeat protein